MNGMNICKTLAVLGITSAAVAACDRTDDAAQPAAVTDAPILRYIPANTPYVFAMTEPVPEALFDKLEPKIDRLLKSYQTVLREAITAKRAELSDEERDSQQMQRASAVIDELTSLMSIEGLAGAGIERTAQVAFYGNGLLPVFRIGLTDGALFEAAVARLEASAEYELPVAKVGNQPYRFLVAEQAKFIVAVIDDYAVLSVVPANLDEGALGLVLGLTPPDDNLLAAGTLNDLAREFGYLPQQSGYVDVRRFVDRFLDQPAGLDAEVLRMVDYDAATLSDVCREEIREMALVAPRLVVGYTELNDERMDTRMVVELRDDLARELMGLTAPVPGLGVDHGGLFSLGFSLDLKAARSFYEARLDAMEADPYECELFAELQSGIGAGREALNQPVPPMIYDFKGVLAVVENIDGMDFEQKQPPKSVDGRLLLAMDNAQALVAMGTLFSPELASMNLQPDGNPVRLKAAPLEGKVDNAYIAMTDDAIALAVGQGAEDELAPMLKAPLPQVAPFFSMSIDAARYYGFVGSAVAEADADGDQAGSAELQAAIKDIMEVVAELYDRMTVDVMFTEQGIEFESGVTFGD